MLCEINILTLFHFNSLQAAYSHLQDPTKTHPSCVSQKTRSKLKSIFTEFHLLLWIQLVRPGSCLCTSVICNTDGCDLPCLITNSCQLLTSFEFHMHI
jgi:hypothetical protein